MNLQNKKVLLSFCFTVIFLIISSGCSNSGTNSIKVNEKSVNFGMCNLKEPHVMTSSSNHIIIEYLLNDKTIADKAATQWCTKSNRIAVEEKYNCQECCRSSYQCR